METVIAAYDGLSRIGEILDGHEAKSIFLVTGRGSYSACGAKDVLDKALADYRVERFFDFEINPKIEDGIRGAYAANAFGADIILAVGGGSPMDVAKLIKAFMPDPASAEKIVLGEIPVAAGGPALICVPTTAGSGSEATHFAVVYIGKDKFSLASPSLLPNGRILDGALLRTASPYQRAVNGLDALAQATEGAWAAKSTDKSRALSFAAIEALTMHLPQMVNQNKPTALQAVMEAASQAGEVINITKTTAPHAFSYAFTSYHDIPHGHAVWMTLPAVFAFHLCANESTITDPRGETHFRDVMEKLATLYGLKDADNCESTLKAFMVSLGIESNMQALGADTIEKRQFLASKVNRERLVNNPVALSDNDIARIFDFKAESC